MEAVERVSSHLLVAQVETGQDLQSWSCWGPAWEKVPLAGVPRRSACLMSCSSVQFQAMSRAWGVQSPRTFPLSLPLLYSSLGRFHSCQCCGRWTVVTGPDFCRESLSASSPLASGSPEGGLGRGSLLCWLSPGPDGGSRNQQPLRGSQRLGAGTRQRGEAHLICQAGSCVHGSAACSLQGEGRSGFGGHEAATGNGHWCWWENTPVGAGKCHQRVSSLTFLAWPTGPSISQFRPTFLISCHAKHASNTCRPAKLMFSTCTFWSPVLGPPSHQTNLGEVLLILHDSSPKPPLLGSPHWLLGLGESVPFLLCQTLWPDQPYGSCHPVPPDLSVCLPLMRLSFLGAGPRSLSLHLSPLRWYLFHGGSPLVFAKERSQRTKEFIWDAAKISQSSENTLKRVTHESCPVDLSFPDCFHYKSILNTVKEMWEWKR